MTGPDAPGSDTPDGERPLPPHPESPQADRETRVLPRPVDRPHPPPPGTGGRGPVPPSAMAPRGADPSGRTRPVPSRFGAEDPAHRAGPTRPTPGQHAAPGTRPPLPDRPGPHPGVSGPGVPPGPGARPAPAGRIGPDGTSPVAPPPPVAPSRPGPPATAVPRGAPAPARSYGGTPSVVVAGGGSAGHIEPALAVADAVRRLAPGARVTALGTEKGLDTQLIPARGYPLELIPPVPLPRKPTADLLKLPGNVRGAIKRVREVLEQVEADVVVGFGGFVSLPAYLGARGRTPIVVHEANARAGLANKVGARFAKAVAVAVPGTGLPGEQVVGMPLRRSITGLDRAALRGQARQHFGLPPGGPVLLVFGGSQGARTLNEAVAAALPRLVEAGVAVLHAHGRTGTAAPPMPGYRPLPYIERMDLAYAAADVVLGRSGMTTVAELTAVGLPAVYVPLPHGNGEQALNCGPVVEAGGGVLVPDEELTGERALAELLPLLTDPSRALETGRRARLAGHGEADEKVARIVLDVIG